eukprot:1152683-Pelagomonas_calceolata.AAC.2
MHGHAQHDVQGCVADCSVLVGPSTPALTHSARPSITMRMLPPRACADKTGGCMSVCSAQTGPGAPACKRPVQGTPASATTECCPQQQRRPRPHGRGPILHALWAHGLSPRVCAGCGAGEL